MKRRAGKAGANLFASVKRLPVARYPPTVRRQIISGLRSGEPLVAVVAEVAPA